MKTASPCQELLREYGHNAAAIPGSRVPFDFLTDSLQHRDVPLPPLPRAEETFERVFEKTFAFPYAVPLAQGRSAEALLSGLLTKPDTTVLSNLPFPTTQYHPQAKGARVIPLPSPEARQPGNLDLGAVAEHVRRDPISFVIVELCCNAAGGQPVGYEHLRTLRDLLAPRGIPLVLDATRILENSLQTGVPVREWCGLADAMTMSLTKDFPTPIGGVAAFRSRELFERAQDFVLTMGDGLFPWARRRMADAVAACDLSLTRARMKRVQSLHDGLSAAGYPMLEPAGGHAVLIDASRLAPGPLAAESLNHALFSEFGIRGGPQGRYLRLAVPIVGASKVAIPPLGFDIPELAVESIPAGLTGIMRARYRIC